MQEGEAVIPQGRWPVASFAVMFLFVGSFVGVDVASAAGGPIASAGQPLDFRDGL